MRIPRESSETAMKICQVLSRTVRVKVVSKKREAKFPLFFITYNQAVVMNHKAVIEYLGTYTFNIKLDTHKFILLVWDILFYPNLSAIIVRYNRIIGL